MQVFKLKKIEFIFGILPALLWMIGYLLNIYLLYEGSCHDSYGRGYHECSFWEFWHKSSKSSPLKRVFLPPIVWLGLFGFVYAEIKIFLDVKSWVARILSMFVIFIPIFFLLLGSFFIFPYCFDEVRFWIIRKGTNKTIVEILMGNGVNSQAEPVCEKCPNYKERVFYDLAGDPFNGIFVPESYAYVCYIDNVVCHVTRGAGGL